jgi:hypothetical protein
MGEGRGEGGAKRKSSEKTLIDNRKELCVKIKKKL